MRSRPSGETKDAAGGNAVGVQDASGAAEKRKKQRGAAVNGLAAYMVANDDLQAGAQSIVDDASGLRAEAERERKIDAAQMQKHPTAKKRWGAAA